MYGNDRFLDILLSNVLNFSRPHINSYTFFISLVGHSFPLCRFHDIPLCGFSSRLRCHRCTSVRPIPPPPDYLHTPFFFLAGPGPLHDNEVSSFLRSPLRRANSF